MNKVTLGMMLVFRDALVRGDGCSRSGLFGAESRRSWYL